MSKKCHGIIIYFKSKQEDDESHYFTMDLDNDERSRSVFWADGRLRLVYSMFQDVLVLDVTYKTNKFRIPFVPCTDVNHH